MVKQYLRLKVQNLIRSNQIKGGNVFLLIDQIKKENARRVFQQTRTCILPNFMV